MGLWPAASLAAELSSVVDAARARGAGLCLPSIEALANELSTKYQAGGLLFEGERSNDAEVLSISAELSPSPSGDTFYLSASFAPVAGRCRIVLETTISWRSVCGAVAMAYPGYRLIEQLRAEIGALSAGGQERLFLLPAGPATCVSIEKSVFN